MVTLAQLPKSDWHSDYCKRLSGPWAGLFEIRFKADGIMQRPLGFISGPNEFTLLFWAIEKSGKFVPKSACETALKWKDDVEKNRSITNELWLVLE
jgi:hypothetical protein